MHHDADVNLRLHQGDLFHKSPKPTVYDCDNNSHFFKKHQTVDFCTYFNVLPIKKWKTYTYASKFAINLNFKGKAVIEIVEIYRNSTSVENTILVQKTISSEESKFISIEIPDSNKYLIGFRLTTLSDFYIYDGYYSAYIETPIKDVRLSLATTTFKKEEYIKKNISVLKKSILNKDSDLYGHIFVHVIDNGRTLDPTKYNDDYLKVYHNNNVGGSGGYARGMIEAFNYWKNPTHVLLMDDDVMINSESIFRTFYLLRIIKPEYERHFISGAMFDYDHRNIQYEDVGYVHVQDGSYGPNKNRLHMSTVENLLANEEQSFMFNSNSYAGWWYCCIPAVVIEENGLPLPLFVRGDDVEFSLRNNAEFITLNGISIWHVGFGGKFNAAMELYQVHRNSLIIQATSDICSDIDFISRMKRLFWESITEFSYNNAEQILDAIDDYLKGPEFLIKLNGEQCMKLHAGKNEKMMPAGDLPIRVNTQHADVYSYERLSNIKKLLYVITLNGHLLPNILLRNYPQVIAYDWFFVPAKNFRRKKLIAYNPTNSTAYLRIIDRKKALSLILRYRKLFKKFAKENETIKKSYQQKKELMTSTNFWRGYLNI